MEKLQRNAGPSSRKELCRHQKHGWRPPGTDSIKRAADLTLPRKPTLPRDGKPMPGPSLSNAPAHKESLDPRLASAPGVIPGRALWQHFVSDIRVNARL